MTSTDALAWARRLLTNGFVISAANVLVDDAREAARESLEPPGGDTVPVEARREALVNALDLAVARLQQHRDAIRDAPGDTDAASPAEPEPGKKGRKKRT